MKDMIGIGIKQCRQRSQITNTSTFMVTDKSPLRPAPSTEDPGAPLAAPHGTIMTSDVSSAGGSGLCNRLDPDDGPHDPAFYFTEPSLYTISDQLFIEYIIFIPRNTSKPKNALRNASPRPGVSCHLCGNITATQNKRKTDGRSAETKNGGSCYVSASEKTARPAIKRHTPAKTFLVSHSEGLRKRKKNKYVTVEVAKQLCLGQTVALTAYYAAALGRRKAVFFWFF
ncbi:hypothetical protein GWI33_014448 [Rhynchophorus ferrugineus]|uniref:Uncharacterized protein n=1 Tax=Rhynchophorus ferrugineus TaxID=354439 RepID=A0A834M5I7_RHYFE|nr:hypothetical protein GWI33_014448 [Rhynchophorus ferrugineus]